MLGSEARRQRRKDAAAAARQETITKQADRLHKTILFWLRAMEQRHNMRNGPIIAFGTTGCTGGNGAHWHTVQLLPKLVGANAVACTAPRDAYPDEVLQMRVIRPLREAGYTVSDPKFHRCGCATFTALPRWLAGQK